MTISGGLQVGMGGSAGIVITPGINLVSTGTVLDDWLGGFPAGGLTLIWGPPRCGRTLILCALARGLTSRTGIVHFNGIEPLSKPFQQAAVPAPLYHQHDTLEALGEHLERLSLDPVDAVLIDDFDRHGQGAPGRYGGISSAEAGRERLEVVRALRGRQITAVVGLTARRLSSSSPVPEPAGGNGLLRAADLVIQLSLVAVSLGDHSGIIVEATVIKSRRETPPPCYLWMRPAQEPPLRFA